MKTIGIVRHFDSAGRITLPIELRKELHISPGDYIEVFTEDDEIILRKYQNKCILCDELIDINDNCNIHGKSICKNCVTKIKSSEGN